MKEFVLIFRQPGSDNNQTEDIRAIDKKWADWIGGIAAQGKLSSHGLRLDKSGNVLKYGGVVTDGPFVETREILGGLIVVKASDLEEATTLAHGCPAVAAGGSVEIRPVHT